jgi:hypothetical protein
MQLNVQRRLSRGLQMGFAYTWASGNGYTGYDPYTDQIGGKEAIKARYWGPTNENRRHNLVVNYSYNIPTFTEMAVIKQLVMDWQVSGVTKLLSGAALTPSCSTNTAGIANQQPSLTDGVTSRCMMVGDPFTLTPAQIEFNKTVPYASQYHYNVDAFQMAAPNGSVGNFGNTPVGILRNPTWHEWDLTLARRFPINLAGRRNSGVKVQIQAYNIFNEVQFTTMNVTQNYTGPTNSTFTSTNQGRYTATTPPRQVGITARLDW